MNRTPRAALRAAVVLTSSVLVVAGCGGSDDGDEQTTTPESSGVVEGSLDDVCAAGAEEGTLIAWNSEDEEAYRNIFDAFSKDYPGIELESVNLRPDDITQRLITEGAAGRGVETDFLSLTQDKAGPLVERGLLDTDVDWTAVGVAEEHVTASNMVRSERIAVGLSYNTDEVDEADLPSTWEELIDPKWKGEVVVDPRGDQLQLLSLVWGQDETLDYVRRLRETVEPVVVEGATAGLLTVASGENLLTTNGRSAETDEQQGNGAPVEIHYLDVVPAVDYYAAVPAGAPHPNAGACWIGWLYSEAGRDAKQEFAFKGNVDTPEEAQGAEVATIETEEDAALATETAALISDVWAGRS
ncbi:ABC transporter substrate-binding protein [Jiangella mangrovi]|uniref:Iron(III) transport system substrate-binding protein n=1 Tax=Jiangella mangrovi TaxID=1524084 RepID=A0A7W9GN36_9ACTN|nr:extracellular solute-binding protein [Jiangella mangrovi]MBB5786902.1 iron(III) transport system substrate-binding protein [Jiangella mangrovi]